MLKVVVIKHIIVVKAEEGRFNKRLHGTTVFLGRTTRAAGAIDESADTTHLQNLILLGIGDVLVDLWQELCSYSLLDAFQHFEGIGDRWLLDINHLAGLQWS